MLLGCLVLVARALAGPAYPLKASGNGRYLVDQNNAPFLCVGDAPHLLVVNVSDSDTWLYLTNRAGYGVNTLWVEMLASEYVSGRPDGSLPDGTQPFTGRIGTGDYDATKPNESYFARVDTVVRMAGSNHIQVLLDLLETGGWSDFALNNGSNACRVLGQYVGNRYKDFANILWITGNDYQNWDNLGLDECVKAIAQGVMDCDTNHAHLHTLQLNYPVSDSLEDTYWTNVLSVDGIFTYYPSYAQTRAGYNRNAFLPVLFIEGHYENEESGAEASEYGTPYVLRRQEYWSLLSGALAGHMYGSRLWSFYEGWQGDLNSSGMAQLQYFKNLFTARAWYNLAPDQTHTVVTSGYGAYTADGLVSESDYATTAATADGTLAVCYMPTVRTIGVDLAQMAGRTVATWFDPAAGTYAIISTNSNSGAQSFTPPGTNAAGDGDWVLLLEAPAPGLAAPQITAWTFSNTNFAIRFSTVLQQRYEVQSAADPVSGPWSAVATNIPGTGGMVQVADTNGVSKVRRFYRVKTGG